MPFSRSRSIESRTRSATSSLARKAPDCHSIASTSVVLPWSTWATIATLRRSARPARAVRALHSAGEPGTLELGVQGKLAGDLLDVGGLVGEDESDPHAGRA